MSMGALLDLGPADIDSGQNCRHQDQRDKRKGADTKLINHTTDQDNSTKPAKAWYFRLPMA
jgi:hypothetical protein